MTLPVLSNTCSIKITDHIGNTSILLEMPSDKSSNEIHSGDEETSL